MNLDWRRAGATLVTGLVLGGALGWTAGLRAPRRWHGRSYSRLLDKFSSRLKLSPDQRARAAAVLEAKRGRVEALREEVRPRFQEIRSSTRRELRALLDFGQQAEFDRMTAEWDARRAERGERRQE